MYLKSILTIIIYLVLSNSFDNQAFAQEYKIKTIVIDAGHGGKDGATHGVYSKEKDVALKTALNLGRALQDSLKDIKVIYTQTHWRRREADSQSSTQIHELSSQVYHKTIW